MVNIKNDSSIVGGSVKGSWTIFKPSNHDYGVFKKITTRQRINNDAMDNFVCIHNTNLHEINFNDAKGYLLMCCNEQIKNDWRLCFVYKLSMFGSILFQWKGTSNTNGVPSFFYYNLEDYINNFESNFDMISFQSIPRQSYFVNIIFKKELTVPSFMHRNGGFPKVNTFDGCYDQNVSGPCKLFIPRLTLQDNEKHFSESKMDNQFHCLPSWKELNHVKNGKNQLHDIIFVPIFKYQDKPHRCMAFASPFEHTNSKKLGLPKNWVIRNIIEYEFIETLPEQISIQSFHNDISEFAISMEQRLTYEGDFLRVFFIKTLKDWKKLLKVPFDSNQKLVKYGKGHEAILTTSDKDPIEIPGAYVSGWNSFHESSDKCLSSVINYQFGATMHKIIRNGHGGRKRSRNEGVNHYMGYRSNKRACKSPAVGPNQTDKQQYFREIWAKNGQEVLRLYLESTVRELPVQSNMKDISFNYSAFIGFDTCDKLIWTSGKPDDVFSFSNETHVDSKDFVDKDNKISFIQELDSCAMGSKFIELIKDHIRKIFDLTGELPMPTTCAYLHCWDNDKDMEDRVVGQPFHYFDYPQIGLMKKIGHENSHWMLPSTFYHRTTLCIVVHNGIVFLKQHRILKPLMIIAWGRSGGSAESSRNAKNRLQS